LSLPECPHQPRCYTSAGCPFRQSALRKVASQLLLGLSILHDQMGYIHADLKPENILRCRTGTAFSKYAKFSFTKFDETEINWSWQCSPCSTDTFILWRLWSTKCPLSSSWSITILQLWSNSRYYLDYLSAPLLTFSRWVWF
jgi:serine/threonine protein kinase